MGKTAHANGDTRTPQMACVATHLCAGVILSCISPHKGPCPQLPRGNCNFKTSSSVPCSCTFAYVFELIFRHTTYPPPPTKRPAPLMSRQRRRHASCWLATDSTNKSRKRVLQLHTRQQQQSQAAAFRVLAVRPLLARPKRWHRELCRVLCLQVLQRRGFALQVTRAQTHTHARTHTHIHTPAHTHTLSLTQRYTCARIHMHTHSYTRIRTPTHAHIETSTHTHTHTHTHTRRHTHIHALALQFAPSTPPHTSIHACTHTHTRTHTYTRTCERARRT